MKPSFPLFSTVVVLCAVAVMIGLGVWQLGRAEWKAGLLDRYAVAGSLPSAEWPSTPEAVDGSLYRKSAFLCDRVLSVEAEAGRNASKEMGWAQIARCAIDGGGQAEVALGWVRQPQNFTWEGGRVSGIIAPGRDGEARLILDPPAAGLAANAMPDPQDLPNNHLSYAWQWFFFAAVALVIYIIALRRKLAPPGAND